MELKNPLKFLRLIDQTTGFKIDLYPSGNDPLVAWGLENRKLEDVWKKV